MSNVPAFNFPGRTPAPAAGAPAPQAPAAPPAPPAPSVNIFAGIDKVDVNARHIYLNEKDGDYILQINRVVQGVSTRKLGLITFTMEMTVLKSSGASAHPVGTKCSWYTDASRDTAMKDVKRVVMALYGIESKAVTENHPAHAFGPTNPFANWPFSASVKPRPAKDKLGNPILDPATGLQKIYHNEDFHGLIPIEQLRKDVDAATLGQFYAPGVLEALEATK